METKKKPACAECERLQKMLEDEQCQHLCDREKAEGEKEQLLDVIETMNLLIDFRKRKEEERRQRSVRYLIATVPMADIIIAMCILQNNGLVSENLAAIIECVMLMGIAFCAAVIWERIKK